ncbi:MAG TPA: pentapeptide repeat-containing protein [Solirubrobacterales bacterium]|nr:pentapeptide repeat-containing protein [Solirubrobacterales bacterium]
MAKRILRSVWTRPLRIVLLAGLIAVVLAADAVRSEPERLGAYAGLSLFLLFVYGGAVALAALRDEKTLEKATKNVKATEAWGEIGRSLLVAGLLAFAVWLIGDLRRPIEEREALQASLGFQQQMPGIDLHGKDLNRFDLSGKNLEDADLEDADLREASLVDTRLRGADLSGADLTGANLEAADLREADLSEARLVAVTARVANLREARMEGADLTRAQLSGADLRRACLTGGSLVGAMLPDAHLEGAALTEANLAKAKFWFDLRPTYLRKVGLWRARNLNAADWPPRFKARATGLVEPGVRRRPGTVTQPRVTAEGKVLEITDGDTVLLGTPRGERRVRLIGLDAPELTDPGGHAALETLEEMIPVGTPVGFAYDTRRSDVFDRNLLYLFDRQERLVNQRLLRRGVAVAAIDPQRGRPNDRYSRELLKAEAWARQHALGLWRSCPP